MPVEVRVELQAADAPTKVRSWANRLPDCVSAGQVKAMLTDDPKWRSLDAGEEAARQGRVSLPEALERLKQTSFRYPSALARQLLAEELQGLRPGS